MDWAAELFWRDGGTLLRGRLQCGKEANESARDSGSSSRRASNEEGIQKSRVAEAARLSQSQSQRQRNGWLDRSVAWLQNSKNPPTEDACSHDAAETNFCKIFFRISNSADISGRQAL